MTRNKSLGNAGEFYVLAQLAQLGYIAGKTDDGQTLIDVIATDPETLRTVNVQVKATTDESQAPKWLMSAKNEQVFESLWYVLVALKDPATMPRFYVFHSGEIGPWLHADHSLASRWGLPTWTALASRHSTTGGRGASTPSSSGRT